VELNYILDPRTKLPDPWRFFLITPQTLKTLWSKVSKYDILFTDHNRFDFVGFGVEMGNSVVLYHPHGFVRVTGVVPGMKAELHGVSFEGGLSRYCRDYRELQKWIFDNFPIFRLEMFVPSVCKSVRKFFTEKCGWRLEGTLRKRRLYKGSLIDINVLSILREEVENGIG
jgi:hypothetical protein